MDRATMTTEVRQRLGEDFEDFWKTDHIHRMLNEGIQRFAAEEKWHWLYTMQPNIPVAQGATTIELIDDVSIGRHFSLLMVNGTEMYWPSRVPPADGARMRALARTGTPQFYFVSGTMTNVYEDGEIAVAQTIHLVPPTDRAYTAEFHFIRKPAMLTADEDEPDIPEQYQDAVVSWATGMLWLKELNGGGKAQEQFSLYREVLNQAQLDQKQLSVDEAVVWGKQDPEPWNPSPREWYARHLPQNL